MVLIVLCLARGLSAGPLTYVRLVWASERLLELDEDCHEIRVGAWYYPVVQKLFPNMFEKMSKRRVINYHFCIDKLRIRVEDAIKKNYIFQESQCFVGFASFRVFHFIYYVKRMLPCNQNNE